MEFRRRPHQYRWRDYGSCATDSRAANGIAAIPGTVLHAIVENQNTSPCTLQAPVLQVANLLTGEVIAEVELGPGAAARHVRVVNGYAWVVMSDGANEPGTSAGGLALVDLSDTANPKLVAEESEERGPAHLRGSASREFLYLHRGGLRLWRECSWGRSARYCGD